ncbi:hypothetical protein K144316041_p21360 (plasmid) [Clostridium tetani]|uniref:hypothetical protein n=1 Tax=Clostridium tetani TaxID=1513 RepID=UPI002955AC80|nr:hypothetical protein [Clostridium tetani]BDR74297.1 hypothetical protein K144316041_p21360 [Clostridium tetani]
MIQICYSRKYDKFVKEELVKNGMKIFGEEQEEDKTILTLDKFPTKNKNLLKTDWEMY